MVRSIIIFLAGAVIGAPVGAFLWYAFSPLLFDEVVTETLAEAQTLATGQFRDADSSHRGTGQARLVRLPGGSHEVQFTAFEVTNGPDLEVWLSAHPNPQSSADVKAEAFLSVGQLKGNVGDQAYDLPGDTDVTTFPSVVVWCEQFGVLFSSAVLSPPS